MAYSAGNLELSLTALGSSSTISSLDAVTNRLTKLSATTTATRKNVNKGIGKIFSIGRLYSVLFISRLIGRAFATIVKYGSDFTETLNMWQVAMRNSLDTAEKFVNQMHRAYGISTEALMRNQAIYKNMLSQMGQMTEETSYALSESLTRMMLDYSSLWNVTIEQASEKFKAMLAGQIRPIRAVSGISVEEQAIYDIYKGMGGTKTMRQLTQVEKRLLRIYATFYQMEQSGATGDFAKTIEQFANQSRLMGEYWKELVTWIGIGIKQWIEQAGIMQWINALLITTTEIVKAMVDYEEPNFLDGMLETTEAENDEIDKLQGKLLDFDKFRALEDTAGQGDFAIDQKVLDLLASYNSTLDGVKNSAQELADEWLSKIFDEDGEFTTGAKILLGILEAIGIALGLMVSKRILTGLVTLASKITGVTKASTLLNYALVGGAIVAIWEAVEAFKDGHIWAGILATTIGVVLVGAFILANKKAIITFYQTLGKKFATLLLTNAIATGSFALSVISLSFAFAGLLAAGIGAYALIKNWGDMNTWQKIIAIIGVATTAILGLAMAFGVFHSAWSIGLASAGIVAGIAMIVGSIATVKKDASVPVEYKANGGMVDKGTMFIAGEAGAEIVSTSSSGQTGVSNVDQIAQATYRGNMMFWAQAKRDLAQFGSVTISADSEGIFRVVRGTAKKQGLDFAKV